MHELHCGDCLDIMRTMDDNTFDAVFCDPPYGLEFMGKDWDHGVPGAAYWEETLRVCKSGAFLLAFGGSRTYHRLTCAIEDAGWEIRDCIMWIHAQGFPKSADISKAIDKAAGAENHDKTMDITAPATDAARAWHGYGTALKPAFEPVVVAMKPVDGTFANNALTWHCGGLNIDGARVPVDWNNDPSKRGFGQGWNHADGRNFEGSATFLKHSNWQPTQGRWPANVIHDGSDEVIREFDKAGEKDSRPVKKENIGISGSGEKRGLFNNGSIVQSGYYDTGSAARFFYCAKAGRSERNAGDVDNRHPTVKPLAINEYLARLILPPQAYRDTARLLVPFSGSGSEMIGALHAGWRNVVGIEQDAEYIEIARRRIEHWTMQPALLEAD